MEFVSNTLDKTCKQGLMVNKIWILLFFKVFRKTNAGNEFIHKLEVHERASKVLLKIKGIQITWR